MDCSFAPYLQQCVAAIVCADACINNAYPYIALYPVKTYELTVLHIIYMNMTIKKAPVLLKHTSALGHFTSNHPQYDYTQISTHSHPHMRAYTHTHTHTHTVIDTNAHTHTQTHAWPHNTCTHTHTHTHTPPHTHTLPTPPPPPPRSPVSPTLCSLVLLHFLS